MVHLAGCYIQDTYFHPTEEEKREGGLGSDKCRSKMPGSSTNPDVDPGTMHGIDTGRMATVLEVTNVQGQPPIVQ